MARKKSKKKNPIIDIPEKIEDVSLHVEYKRKYYRYGISVIEERALPDIRDGLKPVHRAIIYEMLKSYLTSNKKPAKVAKIVGAVIGFWHPHGDSSVEDALALMAAPWKNSMPPILIKGNGGSVYGDGHAAGRYIEAKLSPTGDAYGHKLKEGIVPYEPNFDETLRMPTILPAQLPYLLINGGDGIAVGVASSIPTHNPIEVVNALISYIKKPKQSVEELMEILQGPDFPTKGEIINKSELAEIYRSGVGKIRVRGKMEYEKKTNTIHIYEIPATTAGVMDKLVDEIALASMETINKHGKKVAPKIAGISNVLDHSGKNGIDITIYLRRGVDAEQIMKELYAKTRMETTLKYNFTAINDKHLKRYGLCQYFKEYTAFLHEITINEFTMEKQRIEERVEIIKGLLIMQQFIDEVIASAKASNNKAQLRDVLQTGNVLKDVDKKYHKNIKAFHFTELQSEHIASLPIYKINKLDYSLLVDEGKQLQKDMLYADGIIQDTSKRKRLIIKRLVDEVKKLDVTEFSRKTQIIDAEVSTPSKLEIPETPLYVGINKYQYLRIEEKMFDTATEITNKSRLGFIDESGICWNLHMENTNPTKEQGTLVHQLLNINENIVGWSSAINDTELHYGLFIFKDGNMKLTDMRKYMTKTKATKVASGKSEFKLVKYIDVPKDAVGIVINEVTYSITDFSINGLSGHGKHMVSEIDDSEPITIDFITDETQLPKQNRTIKSKSKSTRNMCDGVAYFDGTDTLKFDWTESEPSKEALFAISYPKLLKSKILFIHDDGTAKIVDGSQFKVSTKRTSIQADKKGCRSIYIGLVPNTILATYVEGVKKRIKTNLISNQGKSGGGIRAFYSKKYTLESVQDGETSELECVSLATRPKA